MSAIWKILFIGAIAYALITGNGSSITFSLMQSGEQAVHMVMTLLGAMTLWSGLMEILCATGDVARIGRMLHRLGRPLFPGLSDETCWNAMGMNISANLLGLGNAATPSGIDASIRLAAQGEEGLRALGMLLVLNNTGLQLIPTTVIALRQSAGSADPAGVWLPTMLVSAISTLVGILVLLMLDKWRRRGCRA